MRWPWSARGKGAPAGAVFHPAPPPARQTPRRWLAFLRGRRADEPAHGPWLRLARDYLLAQGARIRMDEDALIAGELSDSSLVTYTDTPERAGDGVLLLVPGSAAVTQLVAEIEARSRIGAMRLTPAAEPLALAASFSAPPHVGQDQESSLRLHWEKRPARATTMRSYERTTAELEFRVSGRDHFGRIADTVHIGVDPASGEPRPILELAQVAAAQYTLLPPPDRDMLRALLGQMDGRLRRSLDAAATFLRMRSEPEYRRRIETASALAARARRERPESARETEQALHREIAALGAVFAVEVECALAAAWVIHTPMASVAYHLASGATVEITLDLGRAVAETLTCAVCQTATREATICAHGHMLCAACHAPAPSTCAICVGAASANHRRPVRRTAASQPTVGDHKGAATGLDLEGLALMSPAMWRACVNWLLERQGYTMASALTSNEAEARWRGVDAEDRDVFIRALRRAPGRELQQHEVVETARLAREQHLDLAVLLTAAAPSPTARDAAEANNMQIIDGEALRAQLASLAVSYDRQIEGAAAETKARAHAAVAARVAIRKALVNASKALGSRSAQPRVVGSAALALARERLCAARISTEQAFLAWETLLAGWLAAFGPAPAHDGSLTFLVDANSFKALRERAGHLGNALESALREIADTPADGEMGYDAWRAAVVEEARLRCAALETRLRVVDPAEWMDYDAARASAREAEDTYAERAAAHASARADKAQSQVAQLAG
jgi:hypothetical protein